MNLFLYFFLSQLTINYSFKYIMRYIFKKMNKLYYLIKFKVTINFYVFLKKIHFF